jgi:hypothetical protein
LERDPDEELERAFVERLDAEPERAFVERLDAEPERAFVERLDAEPERAFVERLDADPEPAFVDRLDDVEPDRLDDGFARALLDPELDRERLDAEREPELLAREPELRDALDERLEPFDELREPLDEGRRELDRDVPLRRSAAGISSFATAFASCGICFSRNLAIRSSSRRMPRASLAVSLSFTASASASMPV